ncbi:adenosylcobinamide amidohydrolase [Desulfospira joergensenii]|uniref:adenosylcobinamide amidohydrolase n=1 Tax=Desulfospira joergensenii TaxID=53329 RepID=UPI0003B38E6C|nr:adenosylcobinamide amidohydrolase [Desulfospira joergensenii]
MRPQKSQGIKNLFLIAIAAFCLVLPQSRAWGFEITDSLGNRLSIEHQPQRLVSLVPTATEILFELGAEESVLGLTFHDATLRGADGKTVVGGFFQPSIEKIKALNPDMIILSSLHQEVKETFKDSPCKLFVYGTKSIEHSYENILTLGRIFQKEEAAQTLVQKNRAQIEHIGKKLAKAVPGKRKRVIRLMGRDQIMTPGNESFQNELIRLAGGIPPDFGKPGSVVPVTREEWTRFNPQVIYGCGGDEKAADLFFSQEGWKDVEAVKKGRIYYFPCELTCRAASHTGYFISWLSSMIYTREFAAPENEILPTQINFSGNINIDLDYVKSAKVNRSFILDFENKTLMIDFKTPQTIVSSLEGERSGILTVGNHYSPPPTWGPGHFQGIESIRSGILKANKKKKSSTAFLITGADMDNLSLKEKRFKEMKVVVAATAGVMSNAVRMSKDIGKHYEPGTINIIVLTNMKLSRRAMTRGIISATEAKTAALEDLDIRSTYTPLENRATGTGTDNILMVQGEGETIENAGGHSKMGELIARAVYDAVREAILNQNKITARRHVFQRLKERKLSIHSLASNVTCECMNIQSIEKSSLSGEVEHLLLEPRYSAFIESAFVLSDQYEKGLIRDLSLYEEYCLVVASQIAGRPVELIEDLVTAEDIPRVMRTSLNAVFTGVLERLRHE